MTTSGHTQIFLEMKASQTVGGQFCQTNSAVLTCQDTSALMMRHCRTLCTSGCSLCTLV